MYQAVVRSNVQPIVASFEIKGTNKAKDSLLVDVTDFIGGDTELTGFDSYFKLNMNVGNFQKDKSYIVGVKNITTDEPFFQGHFPQEPVMPGVLQIEAMAQTGGLLVLNSVDEPERYSTYFMTINNVKFRQKVVPGDTLILRLELLAPIRRGISTMQGYVFVGDKLVSEAQFMAQIIKNK